MMNEALISVIVPVYNVEKYIDQCIQSLVEQTYKNMEFILVDDGSSDKSGQKCDEWKKKDGRIIVIHQENRGLSATRNRGLQIAKGEFIGFVDSDDYVAETMYEKLITAICENEADVAMCHEFTVEGERVIENSDEVFRIETRDEYLLHFNAPFRGPYMWVWNKLYRRKVLEGLRFWERKALEDIVFTVYYVRRVSKVIDIGESLYFYRQRPGSTMKTASEKVFKDYAQAILYEYEKLNRIMDSQMRSKHKETCLSILFQIESQAYRNDYNEACKQAKEAYNQIYDKEIINASFKNRIKYSIYRYICPLGYVLSKKDCM